MAIQDDSGLENQSSGVADWDTGLNANFTILNRGIHAQFSAGAAINSGDVLWVNSGGIALPYDARSISLRHPRAMSYKAVNSGESDTFLIMGIVRSIDTLSGHLVAGKDVYVSPATPGFPVSSYSAAAFPAGIAIDATGILFQPGRDTREEVTTVNSLGLLAVNSTHAFTFQPGHRGIVKKLEVLTGHNLWTLKLYSGSAAVNSMRLYETQSGGVTSTYALDQGMFPFWNTDTASPGLIFGRVTPASGSVVASGHVNITMVHERLR